MADREAGALPPASVVVCSRDRTRMLEEAVRSIAQHAYAGVEIVVVDQSAKPHPSLSRETRIGPCDLAYRLARSTGASRARNEGARVARHELLVYVDDDILAKPEWLSRLVSALLAGGTRSAATGRVEEGAPEAEGVFVPGLFSTAVRTVYEGRLDVDVLASGNMSVRRLTLDELGGFDERLGAGGRYCAAEDNDLGFRLLEAGGRIVFEPAAVVVHRAWRPRTDYVGLSWRYGYGKGAFYAKHSSLHDRHMVSRAARDVGRHLANAPRDLIVSRRAALGDLAYVAGILAAGCRWLLTEPRTAD
jgi:GT2 family glycosyltransferase